MSVKYTPAERDEAWKRLGVSRDGEIAIQKLYDELTRLAPQPDDVGALREHEGRRRFARELIELMNSESGNERAGDSGRFLSGRREPIGTGSVARGAARRVPFRAVDDDGA
jgi:hypothetical protein